jgi:genome maintenance exonuclease 1
MIDFKTTRKPKKREWIDDYFLQCAAYAEAHNQLYGTEIKTSVIMMIGWDAEADNLGNYQEFVVQDEEYDKYSLQWANKVQEYFDKFM